jgi:NADH-quinone oxidoreductase subunit L
MLVPLVVLALLSLVGGGVELPFNDTAHRLEHWLEPVVEFGEVDIEGTWADDHLYLLLAVAIVVALTGIVAGWLVYQKRRVKAVEPAILANAWYYDQTVTEFMGGPGRESFEAAAWFDANVVDGAVNGTGRGVRDAAGWLRKGQNGFVRAYAGIIGVGVVVMLAWFIIGRGIL